MQPVGKAHTVTIIEGANTRTVSYLLDKDGRVMNQDVTRSEVLPRPSVSPPEPSPPQPAPAVTKNDRVDPPND